jgi:2Fe-2S ferredoxin
MDARLFFQIEATPFTQLICVWKKCCKGTSPRRRSDLIIVTFVDHRGERQTASARPGTSLMEVARRDDVPGILAECGGACACATCRVFIDPAWAAILGPPNTRELAMLEMAPSLKDNARLACQVTLVPALDGLIVETPASQH